MKSKNQEISEIIELIEKRRIYCTKPIPQREWKSEADYMNDVKNEIMFTMSRFLVEHIHIQDLDAAVWPDMAASGCKHIAYCCFLNKWEYEKLLEILKLQVGFETGIPSTHTEKPETVKNKLKEIKNELKNDNTFIPEAEPPLHAIIPYQTYQRLIKILEEL